MFIRGAGVGFEPRNLGHRVRKSMYLTRAVQHFKQVKILGMKLRETHEVYTDTYIQV
jgi:hypothetical protein